jgi:hypothetical protein
MSTEKYFYNTIETKQQPDGPNLYLAKVKARELLEWADVPRKKSDFKAGYQRQLKEERTDDIRDFVESSKNNLMPGALLISVKEESFSIEENGNGYAEIKITHSSGDDLQGLIEKTYDSFYSRLNEREKEFADGNLDINIEDLDEGSPLPSSYLAELTRELRVAKEDFSELDEERQEAIKDYVTGMSKPGRILDGQHRVFGAKDIIDFDVVFPIVLIPGLSESEQVFHFFIVNNKARPLKPVELRATISTSLTDREIDNLYDRLQDAGVQAEEAKLTYRMNKNPNSPFQGLIDFGLGEDVSFIKENVANQVVLNFVDPPSRFSPLYEDVSGWTQDPEYNYRMSMFFTFWRTVKETYSEAWEKGVEEGGGNLFYKVSMLKLQEKVLENLKPINEYEKTNTGDSVFSSRSTLKRLAKLVLNQLPERFWLEEWQEQVSDSADFREYLKEQMQKAMDGADIGRLGLFRKTG